MITLTKLVLASNASFAIVVAFGRLMVSKAVKFLNVLAGIVAFSVNLIEVAAVNPFNVANSSVVNSTLEMMFVN